MTVPFWVFNHETIRILNISNKNGNHFTDNSTLGTHIKKEPQRNYNCCGFFFKNNSENLNLKSQFTPAKHIAFQYDPLTLTDIDFIIFAFL